MGFKEGDRDWDGMAKAKFCPQGTVMIAESTHKVVEKMAQDESDAVKMLENPDHISQILMYEEALAMKKGGRLGLSGVLFEDFPQLTAVFLLETYYKQRAIPGGADFGLLAFFSIFTNVANLAIKALASYRSAKQPTYFSIVDNANLHKETNLAVLSNRESKYSTSNWIGLCDALGRYSNMALLSLIVRTIEGKPLVDDPEAFAWNLARALPNLRRLRNLNIGHSLGPKGGLAVVAALQDLTRLKVLDLSFDDSTSDDYRRTTWSSSGLELQATVEFTEKLVNVLPSLKQLQKLTIGMSRFGPGEFISFFESACGNLTRLESFETRLSAVFGGLKDSESMEKLLRLVPTLQCKGVNLTFRGVVDQKLTISPPADQFNAEPTAEFDSIEVKVGLEAEVEEGVDLAARVKGGIVVESSYLGFDFGEDAPQHVLDLYPQEPANRTTTAKNPLAASDDTSECNYTCLSCNAHVISPMRLIFEAPTRLNPKNEYWEELPDPIFAEIFAENEWKEGGKLWNGGYVWNGGEICVKCAHRALLLSLTAEVGDVSNDDAT
jgi:hypothetical protein